jgi:DNA polymerase-3 subunit alpha|tara:strand:+ start:247 stop:1770 length:1524 start_codon:yes stop_codon:yes gene_type:complete
MDITKIPLNDKRTWDLICSGHTKGVFQLETHLGKHWCKEAKPHNIEELADVISIIRPGTLKAIEDGKSMTQRYVDRKHGTEETRSLYKPIDNVITKTYNIIIYQEQAMQIAQVMAGFTESQADTLRKAIGKKKADLMRQVKGEFIEGCLKENHTKEDADRIFDIIEKSNRYSFNKSHAVSYAVMAYWSAYLKANNKLEFYLHWLSNAKEKIDPNQEIYELVESAKIDHIDVKTPLHEHPESNFSIQGKDIFFGITNVKNVGVNEFVKIKNFLDELKPKTWVEYVANILPNVNKRAVNNLIAVGFFAGLGKSRSEMTHEFSCVKDLSKKELEVLQERLDPSISLQDNLIKLNNLKKDGGAVATIKRLEAYLDIINRLKNPGRSLKDNPMSISISEENLLGAPISYSKVDGCADASFANTTCKEILDGKKSKSILAVEITEVKEYTTKNKDNMAFLSVRDDSLEIENVVVFPDTYREYEDIIYETATVLMFGQKAKDRNSFIVNEINQI